MSNFWVVFLEFYILTIADVLQRFFFYVMSSIGLILQEPVDTTHLKPQKSCMVLKYLSKAFPLSLLDDFSLLQLSDHKNYTLIKKHLNMGIPSSLYSYINFYLAGTFAQCHL